MERFLYEVKPLRPIRKPGQSEIRRPFVALLTIDEVKEYMKYGPVYRKYADVNKEMIKVTGENIAKLHRDPEDKSKASKISVSDLFSAKDSVKVEAEPKKLNVEESTTSAVVETSTENNETIAESEPVANDNSENTNNGENIVDGEEEVASEIEVEATVLENDDTDSDNANVSEEVENDTIEETNDTADQAIESENATESEEQVDTEEVIEENETENVEVEKSDENTGSTQKQQNYNNYNKNKKHKYNNNNVQFKQQ